MSEDEPQERPPVPTLIWAILAVLVVGLFVLILRVLNPASEAIGSKSPELLTPGEPKPASR